MAYDIVAALTEEVIGAVRHGDPISMDSPN
jgi:hypothetical protein